jgi:lysophospholipase L1-like esterase
MLEMSYRLLALGDSYTIGEGVDAAQSWPYQLTRALRADGLMVKDPYIVAQTGWTTRDLLNAMEGRDIQGPIELAALAIGVNNQYQGKNGDSYRDEFEALLGMAIGLAGDEPGRVLVLSIPDWGVTPFAEGRPRAQIQAEIAHFNNINRAISQSAGAHYLDITPISRLAAQDPGLLAADALHVSGGMYARWVDLMLPVARRILREQKA